MQEMSLITDTIKTEFETKETIETVENSAKIKNLISCINEKIKSLAIKLINLPKSINKTTLQNLFYGLSAGSLVSGSTLSLFCLATWLYGISIIGSAVTECVLLPGALFVMGTLVPALPILLSIGVVLLLVGFALMIEGNGVVLNR